MLGSLTGPLAGLVSGAVLLREAARTSRRWQTYAARTAFSGILLGVLLLGIWVAVDATRSSAVDTANLAWVGRALFIGFAVVQTLLAMLLAPLQTASAIIEETDERTMEMLVLTRLRPGQILGAKVLSRILVLVTTVCGALPVMALVVNLGGVSTIEVVAVTVHTLTTVVVLSALGAFFALFTRSPMLATAASACYAMPFFVLLPMAYVLCTGNPYDSAHFSTFAAASARDWSALLTPFSYVPALVVMAVVTVPLFQLKVSNADFKHAFSDDVWRTPLWIKACGGWIVGCVLLLPIAIAVSWILHHNPGTLGVATTPARVLAVGVIWALFAVLAALGTWAFLRVGMDVTDGIDSVFAGTPAGPASAERPSMEVGVNPVLWREARLRSWLSTTAPIFVTWLLLLLGVFQTGWWILPGGVLSVGIANAAGAVLLAAWLATRSIAEERRRGTLEVLLASTLPSGSVIVGKFAAAAFPTLPLLVLSLPLIALGVPHAGMFFESEVSYAEQFMRGLASWIWLLPVWGATIVLSMIVALRTNRPRSAFGVVAVALVLVLGLPSVLARLFPDVGLVTFPALLLAPPLAGPFAWWQLAVSTFAGGLLCAGLLSLVTARLRPWAGLLAALLALAIASSEARAEPIPDPETLARMEKLYGLRMAARPIADGLYREARFTTVWVGIENAGPATIGTVSIEGRSGAEPASIVFERRVELPEGARKELLLLVKPGIGEPDRLIRLRTRDGVREAVAPIRLQAVGPEDVVIGVIGRDPLGLPAALRDATSDPVPGRGPRPPSADDRQVRTGLVALPAVPRQSTGWSSVDWVVWPKADPSQLTEAQVQALRAFVADGGHLLVTVTDTWRQVAGSPLAAVLPVDVSGQRDADVTPLARALGGPVGPSGPLTAIAVGTTRPGALVRASTADGAPLWVSAAYGLGSIHVLLADLSTAPLDRTRGDRAWRQLLTIPAPGGNAADELARNPRLAGPLRQLLHLDPVQPFTDYSTWETSDVDLGHESRLRERLSDIPGVAPLPLPWLAGFSLAYLLAIGPLDWLVLRLLRRQPLTWITFPVLIVVFSGGSLALTTLTKGSQAVVVRLEVVDLLPDTGLARGTTMLGLFATGKTRIGVESGFEDGVVEPLMVPGFQDGPVIEAGGGPGTLAYGAETWTLAYAQSAWTTPFEGALPAVRREDGAYVVRNALPFDLDEVAVLIPDASGGFVAAFAPLGPLPRGEELVIPSTPAARPITGGDASRPVEWAARYLSPSLPSWRGALEAEHRAVLVGVADDQVEPLVVSGIRPEVKRTLVVRTPLPDAKLVADFDAFTAIVSLDSTLAHVTGTVTCPDGSSQGAYPVEGVIRVTGLGSDECTLLLWTPMGEHTEKIRPGSRLRCRTITTPSGDDKVRCTSTASP